MEFGLFSNSRRPSRSLTEAWQLDIDEMVAVEDCGFDEVWVSEHESSADLIICRAASVTSRIRLGSAVRVLPIYHPVQVANDAAACDNLTNGRYMLGVGPGFSKERWMSRGVDPETTRERTVESLDLLLRIFTEREKFDFKGKYWSGSSVSAGMEFMQKPYPPMAMSVASAEESAQLAGRKGLRMLTPDFTHASKLKKLGDAFVEGQIAGGHAPDRSKFGVCRVIYVAESDKVARDDMRDSYEQVIRWEVKHTPWHQYDRIPEGGTLEDITFDYLCDTRNLFIGSPATVLDHIETFFEEVGGFGTLIFHGGRDYATPEKLKQSMRLFADEVMPRVRHLAPARVHDEPLVAAQ